MSNHHRTAIVGVDYSDLCIPALDEALRIVVPASGDGVGVLIPLLVLPEEPATRAEATDAPRRIARAKVNLLRLVNSRARTLRLAPPRILPCVRFGDAAASILDEARRRPVDLIAVGTHGRRGLSHLLLGSVAEEVSRQAPCSVLVGRRAEQPTVFDADQHLPLELGSVEGTTDEIDQLAEGTPQSAQILSEAHIEAGEVVLHVLDSASGQTFVCWFSDSATVRVEPLEREWVPAASPAARARATRAALDEALRDSERFATLFAELAHPRDPDQVAARP